MRTPNRRLLGDSVNLSLESLIPHSLRSEGSDIQRCSRAVVIAGGIVAVVAL
jgi:hypothetical protein